MRLWFDTEFIDDGKTIDLISIGMVREDGEEYYAEVLECDLTRASDWVKDNVIPHLTGLKTPRARIARELITFAKHSPEFWTYFGSYDWVVLCQLYGTMMQLPNTWPKMPLDVKHLAIMLNEHQYPRQEGALHNALTDARWTKLYWETLLKKARN